MAGIDAVTLGAAKAYTKASLAGVGAVKGAPCEIQNISTNNKAHTIAFAWEDKNGETHTDSLILQDGKSPYDIAIENGFEGTEAEWLESLKGGNDPTDIDFTSNAPIEDDDPTTDINFNTFN